ENRCTTAPLGWGRTPPDQDQATHPACLKIKCPGLGLRRWSARGRGASLIVMTSQRRSIWPVWGQLRSRLARGAAARSQRATPPSNRSSRQPPSTRRRVHSGIDDPHPLVADLWNAVQTSCEATFYGEADWERLRLELWYANAAMTCGRPLSGNTWPTIQHGLTELLISPAAK